MGDSVAEPMMQLEVEGKRTSFLVDTGAKFSTLTQVAPTSLTDQTLTLQGFSGTPLKVPLTKPLLTKGPGVTFEHSFVASPQCPLPLMGRDILTKLGATVLCAEKGITVTLPNGYSVNCSNGLTSSHSGGQWIVDPLQNEEDIQTHHAQVFWFELGADGHLPKNSVISLFMAWLPWISQHHAYDDPPDPYHCTMFYDKNNDDHDYLENWMKCAPDWVNLKSEAILVGPEGVAGMVTMTEEIKSWYRMSGEASPHITLAVAPSHAAKDLGPMTKRGRLAQDWVQTQIPQVQFSPSTNMYKIVWSTTDSAIPLSLILDRQHGAESTNHYNANLRF